MFRTGYNGASRFCGIVKGVYAGNGSSRHQMMGRVCRIGQIRKEVCNSTFKREVCLILLLFCLQVKYVTVAMENSMLMLLYERQQRVDTMNISLEALAKAFEVDVLGL